MLFLHKELMINLVGSFTIEIINRSASKDALLNIQLNNKEKYLLFLKNEISARFAIALIKKAFKRDDKVLDLNEKKKILFCEYNSFNRSHDVKSEITGKIVKRFDFGFDANEYIKKFNKKVM